MLWRQITEFMCEIKANSCGINEKKKKNLVADGIPPQFLASFPSSPNLSCNFYDTGKRFRVSSNSISSSSFFVATHLLPALLLLFLLNNTVIAKLYTLMFNIQYALFLHFFGLALHWSIFLAETVVLVTWFPSPIIHQTHILSHLHPSY